MPYYHTYIVYLTENGRKRHFLRYNQSEEKVKKAVAIPYMNNKSFVLSGRVYHPSRIDKITIWKSNDRFENLVLPNRKRIVTQPNLYIAKVFRRKEVKGVTACTDKFIVSPPKEKGEQVRESKKSLGKDKVFIVHGRDYKPVRELKAILVELGMKPIVLHEQPSGSRTIVEKLEKYSDVGYAFIILTPDDSRLTSSPEEEECANSIASKMTNCTMKVFDAKEKGDIKKVADLNSEFIKLAIDLQMHVGNLLGSFESRARQNVILEFGYFMGVLGRDRVCCLYQGDVELPSDMHGIVYVPFKESVNEAKDMIVKELKAAGY